MHCAIFYNSCYKHCAGIHFVYYHWYLKKYGTHSVFNTRKETLIY